MTPNPTSTSGNEYKVGPGCPPKETRFKPGQSGNPKGAKRKPPSIVPDLKALFESAFNEKLNLKQGEKEQIVTMWAAGMKQLATQFAKGDRHARRDAFIYADKFGSNLIASQHKANQEALPAQSTNIRELTKEELESLTLEELRQLSAILKQLSELQKKAEERTRRRHLATPNSTAILCNASMAGEKLAS